MGRGWTVIGLVLAACGTSPAPPVPPDADAPLRGSLAIELDVDGAYARSVFYEGVPRWLNVAHCDGIQDQVLCLGVDGAAPSMGPAVRIVGHPPRAVAVNGVQLEEGFDLECTSPVREAAIPTSGAIPTIQVDGEFSGSADGAAESLPGITPLVELESPASDEVLSFRWVPADEPMHLELVPVAGAPIPVVLPVEDDGSLDLTWDQLGLRDDVRSFRASLVRSRNGTLASNDPAPLDWFVASRIGRHVEMAGHPWVAPGPTCEDATELRAVDTFAVHSQTPGFVRIDPPITGHLRLAVRGEGTVVHVRDGCLGPFLGAAGGLGPTARVLTPTDAPLVLQIEVGYEPALVELREEPEPVITGLADTCDDAVDPLGPGRYLVGPGASDATEVHACGGDSPLQGRRDATFPVRVPAASMLTVSASGVETIAVREGCSDGATCLGSHFQGAIAWVNPSMDERDVDVWLEWLSPSPSALSEVAVGVVRPVPLAPGGELCDVPVLDEGIAGVWGELRDPAPAPYCAWGFRPAWWGAYGLVLAPGEEVRIDAAWDRGSMALIERCEDPASVLASGSSRGVESDTLVYRNPSAVEHTYTLVLTGDPTPYALAIGRD